MEKQFDYVTKLDIKYKHLERIDIPEMVKGCTDKWFNQTHAGERQRGAAWHC
jgi:hypothetical protein